MTLRSAQGPNIESQKPSPQPSTSPNANKEHLTPLKAALRMALGTTSSRVLGLVREIAFAALFPRAITDAWIAAFRLPNLFRRLLGEGSLSVSFVPVFVEANGGRSDGQAPLTPQAHELLNGFFTLLLCFLSVLTVLGIMFPEPVLRVLLDPEYVQNTEKFLMTVRLARIMFGFVFLISTYAFWMGVLNALGIFGLPAMAPTLFNVAMIAATLFPMEWFPSPADGLAWGVLVGGLLQALILVPALRKKGALPRLTLQWNVPSVRLVLRNMVPGLIGLGLLQISTLVNMRFASQLGEGPISWINWADRLLELPLSLISVSLGTALLPTLAGQWSRGEREKMSHTLNVALRMNVFLCAGAAAGLYFLAHPIIEVIFQRGRFSVEDTAATATVLQVWALIMLPTACVRVFAPAYYAVKNTWFPAVVSAFCLAVHLMIAPMLMARWGLTGLNMSSLVSSGLNFLLLMSFYHVLVTKFSYAELFGGVARYTIPVAALALAVQVHGPMREFLGETWAMKLLSLSLSIAAGGFAFVAVSHWMKLEEWTSTSQRVFARLKKKR